MTLGMVEMEEGNIREKFLDTNVTTIMNKVDTLENQKEKVAEEMDYQLAKLRASMIELTKKKRKRHKAKCRAAIPRCSRPSKVRTIENGRGP